MSGGRYHHEPFVLDSSAAREEGVGDLVDEVASRFGGLTIVSALEDSSWLGVGESLACPPQPTLAHTQLATCSLASLLSMTSSVSEPPPPHSGIPAVGAGGGHGRGTLWLPSVDSHAPRDSQGKLRLMQLVYVGVKDKICFGLIGTKRFCRSESCRIKPHKNKNNKFAMGTKGGWLLAGKGNSAGNQAHSCGHFLMPSRSPRTRL